MKTPALLLVACLCVSALQAQRLLPLFENGQNVANPMQGPYGEVSLAVNHENQIWFFGDILSVNGTDASGAVTWDGTSFDVPSTDGWPESFQSIRTGMSTPYGLILAMDVSGGMHQILRFNGSVWEQIASNLDGRIFDMTLHEGNLHVVGDFEDMDGTPVNRHIIWDGSDWSSPGSLPNNDVYAIASFESDLIIGGRFENIGTSPAAHVARWNGEDWEQLGLGLDGNVGDFEVFNGQLLASGSFEMLGDLSASVQGIVAVNGDSFSNFTEELPLDGGLKFMHVAGDELLISEGFSQVSGPSGKSYIYSNGSWSSFLKPELTSAVEFEDAYILSSSAVLGSNEPKWPFESCAVYRYDAEGTTTGVSGNQNLTGLFTPGARMFSNNAAGAGLITSTEEEINWDGILGTVYALSPWYSGIDEDSSLYVGASRYFTGYEQDPTFLGFGPISDSYDAEYIDRYCGVWVLDDVMISEHALNYDEPGYEIPTAIETYPGNGRTELGESLHLAPFIDNNENGLYEPELGDSPLIQGDNCVTWIINDDANGAEFRPGIESVIQAYTYNTESEDLGNSYFVQMHMTNRSNRNYSPFSLGVWADLDIGTAYDDFVGCDPQSNMFYTYNGDAMDEASASSPGYGSIVPAQAVLFLQDNMHSHVYFHNSTGITGDPQTAQDFHNYLNAYWLNGQHITWGGNGFNASSGSDLDQPTNFMFPDFPWAEGDSIWNEASAGNPPGGRRSVGAITPFDFMAGDSFCFNFALVTAFEDSPNESLIALEMRVDELQSLWDADPEECEWVQFDVGVEELVGESLELLIFPNPSSGSFRIRNLPTPGPHRTKVLDTRGQMIQEIILESNNLSLEHLPAGFYLIQFPDLGEIHSVILK